MIIPSSLYVKAVSIHTFLKIATTDATCIIPTIDVSTNVYLCI